MNPEIISIISVGVAIIGTLIVLFRWIRQDVRDLRQDVRQEIGTLRKDMSQEIGALRQDVGQEMRDVRREMREMENRLNARIDALLVRPGSAA